MALIKLRSEPKISKCSLSCICPVFGYVLQQVSDVTLSEKNWMISVTTGWTNVDPLSLPDTIEIVNPCGLHLPLGTLSKLTRRLRGGGHIKISIQFKTD